MVSVTLESSRSVTLPNKEGKPVEYLFIPWNTTEGASGTLKIEKEGYSTENVLKLIKKELETPYYKDVGKEFELE